MKVLDQVLIDGEWVRSTGDALTLDNPWNGRAERRVVLGGVDQAEAALEAAARRRGPWGASEASDRIAALGALADELERDLDEIADVVTAEVGTPPPLSRSIQVGLPIRVLRGFQTVVPEALGSVEQGNSVIRHVGLGTVAAITPWNYPIHQAVAKIGAAVAAGCTVVLKASELAPESTQRLAAAVRAALPPGVVNILTGGEDVGRMIVNDPRVDAVSFTGSTAVGRDVARAAAQRLVPASLELGGKSPSVILRSAELSGAVRASLGSGFLNSGQTCNALTRLIVPRELVDDVRDIAQAVSEKLSPKLGPVVSRQHRDRIVTTIEKAVAGGARILAGGPGRPEGRAEGWFLRGTVLMSEDPEAEVVQSEIFGPVVVVQPYDDVDQAVALANGTPFGLAAAVWGAEPDAVRIAARIRAGQVDVNGGRFNPLAPFGGFGQSGGGRELGLHGIRAFQAPVSTQFPAGEQESGERRTQR